MPSQSPNSEKKLDLRNVALTNVEMLYPDEAIRVMNHCLAMADFDTAILYIPIGIGYDVKPDKNLVIKQIPQLGYKEIALFTLRMGDNFYSDFMMTVQNDGFPVRPENWTPDFLDYDYVASPWPSDFPSRNRVGGGGMTLRSRKLLRFCSKHAQTYLDTMPAPHWGDDFWISEVMADKFDAEGLTRCPMDLAIRWGLEYEIPECNYDDIKSFGFHKFTTEQRREYRKIIQGEIK